MKMRARFFLIILLAVACAKEPIEPGPTEGQEYLNTILDLLQKNSVNRKTINWPAFREKVLQKTPDIQTIAQTTQSIELALKMLGDNHTYYKSGNLVIYTYDSEVCPWFETPPDVVTPAGIGYLRIPGFPGTDMDDWKVESERLQQLIRDQDRPDLEGWLVDVRGNGGGVMAPMIAGVGPILGEEDFIHFIDADERVETQSYRGYKYLLKRPYTLVKPNPKVAVLTDAASSAGEGVVVGFIGRPNTRSFGAHGSCGRSTGIKPFYLSDGALLGIANTVMVDRNYKRYGGQILPDELHATNDDAVKAAIAWLLEE